MNKFKFIKNKNKFSWENNIIKLEFSHPQIQPFNSLTLVESIDDILYYYYTLKIFKNKNINNNKKTIKWNLITEVNTYDFPCIQQLKCIIEYHLKNNPVENGQKNEFINGEVRYSKCLYTEGFACDDFYQLTKDTDDKGQHEIYNFYIGTSLDIQGDLNSQGIRISNIYQEEINELLKCINSFVEHTINIYNKEIREDNTLQSQNKEIINGKIYEYKIKNNKINKNKIENIFVINDIISVTCIKKENDKFIKQEYDNILITNIKENSIILDNNIEIPIEEINYIHNEVPEEKLYYDIEKIVLDFLNILSEEEKILFKKSDIHFLLKKYKMAIVNRTSLCRDEHNFDIDYKSGYPLKTIKPIIEEIIKQIKNTIS